MLLFISQTYLPCYAAADAMPLLAAIYFHTYLLDAAAAADDADYAAMLPRYFDTLFFAAGL